VEAGTNAAGQLASNHTVLVGEQDVVFAAVDASHSTGSRDAEFDGDKQRVYGTIFRFS
jgi:hypothetical protein